MRRRRIRHSIPNSSLRSRLEQRLKEKEKENNISFNESYDNEDSNNSISKPFPLNYIAEIHGYMLIKITIVVLIIFITAFLSTLNFPFINSLSDRICFFTTWHMDIEYLMNEVVPVIDQLWEKGEFANTSLYGTNIEKGAIMPMQGKIISPFGIRDGKEGGRQEMHYGLDIGFEGEEELVYATLKGKIVDVVDDPIMGLTIYIDHGQGISSIYARLTESFASPKEMVNQGQSIAVVRSDGNEAKSCLHFEVWESGRPKDPLLLIKNTRSGERESLDEIRPDL